MGNLKNKSKFFFSKFFPINVNSALFWISLLQKSFKFWKNICFETIQNDNVNHSSNLWWLKNADRVKFTEGSVMDLKKNVLVKKCLPIDQTMNMCQKESSWMRNKLYGEREKVRAQQAVKKVMLTVLSYAKGTISIDFFEKSSPVNNASYYQLVRQNSLHTYVHVCVSLV